MGIFDKLAFWKKKDNFDLGKNFGADLGLGNMDNSFGADLGLPPQQGMGRPTGLSQNRNMGMPDDMGFGMGSYSSQPPGQPLPMQTPFSSAPMQPAQPTERDYAKDKFEVVSAKLDSIRYTLDSINQRLANLERMAYGEPEQPKRRW